MLRAIYNSHHLPATISSAYQSATVRKWQHRVTSGRMSTQRRPPARPLYDRVEEIRVREGWSKIQLARRLGLDRGTIDKWKTQPRSPLASTVKDVSERLGIPLDEALALAGVTGGGRDAADVLEEIELQEAAGTDAFETTVRAALDRLPADERSIVEELYAELVETQERQARKRHALERLISVFVHRPKSDGTDGNDGSVSTNGDLAEGT